MERQSALFRWKLSWPGSEIPMTNSEFRNRCGIQKRPVLSAFKFLLVLFTSLLAAVCWGDRVGWFAERFFTAMFLYSAACIVFRWGWVIPCVVGGAICGLFMDNAVKSGSNESQMWETVGSLFFGCFCGFIVGIILDQSSSIGLSRKIPEKATDRTFISLTKDGLPLIVGAEERL
jgi:hypothetical protein